MNDACVIVIAKWPRPGAVKTRLAAQIGTDAASRLSAAFLEDTLDLVCAVEGAAPLIAYTPPENLPQFEALARGRSLFTVQPSGNFGVRLQAAFADAFALGFTRVLIIGSDSPTLPPALLEQALSLLEDAPLVIGPATDGGYYLLGMKVLQERLFEQIDWSTERVFGQTMARAAELALEPAVLSPWYDVDEPEALQQLRRDVEQPGSHCLHTRLALRGIMNEAQTSQARQPEQGAMSRRQAS